MIELLRATIQAGQFRLQAVSLRVPRGAYAILMGPTGCGKTTLLEGICGLRPVVSGQIRIDEQDVTTLPPAIRQVGYVPQHSALFPGQTVRQQLAFPLLVRGLSRAERSHRIDELVRGLELESLLERTSEGLSGGERHRVALARAIAFRPSIVLLDEPFSALDKPAREQLTATLKQLHRNHSLTVLHVTHDLPEADYLATLRLDLSAQGSVVQTETTSERKG